ncbi:uncharacterized protein Z520_09904 [Fonsecaea multimorphosa CBS 102226]|uniref:GED domain-containing protein n=1 Tax=Fonsecaea multimorphosa CBS 102226 TaxID=1442371 RepID=A0A0D2KCS6_9EURO|nr:uncharacterized protein Z520_09904 [Fonsecaea multimorphosa CBS 102226]KIX94518.1 hypothetical protein Z520_09904 [Fonsecaea multimorphosa CBS 102226]
MEPTQPEVHLQIREHDELLDVIDSLRSQGIDRYINLPELIVCGDQSAGKSSVLEAISGGLRFPTKDTLCTRFATELILRRDASSQVKIAIIPDPDSGRTQAEEEALAKFAPPTTSLDDFPAIIDAAATAMGIDGSRKAFSRDTLRIELSGPTQPHLTLVDLPGLYHAGDKHQSSDDAPLIKNLVRHYMAKDRGIILAVVSAQNNYSNQVVTKYAKKMDPFGHRTLGIITKPDTLDPGSTNQKEYQERVLTDDGELKLGWHMLRNRDYSSRHCSAAERDYAEEAFFQQEGWNALPKGRVGVKSLRTRLSRILLSHISKELPQLLTDVQSGISECESRLQKFGSSRHTVALQRKYLRDASKRFSELMKDSVDGDYSEPFFHDSRDEAGYKRRLRAVIQNIMGEFAEEMRLRGHSVRLVDSRSDHHGPNEQSYVYVKPRDEFLEYVKIRMRINRGTELPGIFNPGIIGELFRDQSKGWEAIIHRVRERLMRATEDTITLALKQVTDPRTADAIWVHLIKSRLGVIGKAFHEKTDEVLRPHKKGHPTTLNHYFIENLQKKRRQESRRLMTEKLANFFGKRPEGEGGSDQFYDGQFNMRALLDALVMQTEVDFERFACREATNAMEAYYKVALKTVIDAFNMYAVEGVLLKELPEILASEVVDKLDDEAVWAVAAESAESVAERADLERKLSIFQRSLKTLQRLKIAKISEPILEQKYTDPSALDASDNFGGTLAVDPGTPRERVRPASQALTSPDSAIGMNDEDDEEDVTKPRKGFHRPHTSPRRSLATAGRSLLHPGPSIPADPHTAGNKSPMAEQTYPATLLGDDTNNAGSGSPDHGSGSNGQARRVSIRSLS